MDSQLEEIRGDLLSGKIDTVRAQRSAIRKILSEGGRISGLMPLIRSHGTYFNKALGSWARKRGRLFEVEVVDTLKEMVERSGGGIVYRTPIQRCGSQLYDIVIYLREKRPVFLQCKAGGAQEYESYLLIDTESRAMKNCHGRKPLILDLLEKTKAPYFFVFPHSMGLIMVPYRTLTTKRGRVRVLYEDTTVINQEQSIEVLHELYFKEITEV